MEHLSDLKETARRAFYWSSFNPDKAGDRTLAGHESELQSDLEGIPETEKERYIENYRKYFIKWLTAHSNCASSAVTGGSGFNVRRNEKSNNREQSAYGEFIEWRERALNAIAKKVEDEILCIGDDSFHCPHCGKVYNDEKYCNRIDRNKWGYTRVYCSCGKPFNVTVNFAGEMTIFFTHKQMMEKYKQKKVLINTMRGDEEIGLYDDKINNNELHTN